MDYDVVSLGVENERVDVWRDGQTFIARPNSLAQTRTGKSNFPYSVTFDDYKYKSVQYSTVH